VALNICKSFASGCWLGYKSCLVYSFLYRALTPIGRLRNRLETVRKNQPEFSERREAENADDRILGNSGGRRRAQSLRYFAVSR